MRLLFLDIDGVLNSREVFEKRYKEGRDTCWVISEEMVEVLNRIVESTGCKVVVSSSWRLGNTVEFLNATLKEHGARFEILDVTPRCIVHFDEIRGDEISESMKKYGVNKDSILILDDDGMGARGGQHFLDGRLLKIDGGLQVHHIVQALQIFEK